MLIKIISWILWLINLSICSTLKYRVFGEPPGQSLFAVWHGQTFPLFFWARHRKVCLLPVENWRGDVIVYLAEKYGYRTVRFLEKGTPLERSKNIEALIKTVGEGFDAAIAVDGPPEPLVSRKVKSGILYLSRKTGVPIVPSGIVMKRKMILPWRWDKYEIPLPWSEVEIRFGKPLLTSERATLQELGEEIDRLASGSQNAAG